MSPHSFDLYPGVIENYPSFFDRFGVPPRTLRIPVYFDAPFACWSCGRPCWSGERLDCWKCERMLDDAWTLRRALDGVQAFAAGILLDELRRNLEDLIP